MAPTGAPLVVVGESLVDIVLDLEGNTIEAVGGSPLNVAVGLARLEVPTLFITEVGDDEHGRRVVEHVRSSGAEITPTSVQPGRRTATATARLGADDRVSYEFDLAWELEAQELPELSGLHVGSLGASLSPGRPAVVDLARQAAANDVFVSYDPNIRPAFLHERKQAWLDTLELAALSTLIKVSEDDLELLRPDESSVSPARELLAGRCTELVIITRAAAGAIAISDLFQLEVPAPPVELVDTLGAGDSFMSAVLAILTGWGIPATTPGGLGALDEDRVSTLLGSAMTVAAVTCSRRGANPPTRSELPTTWPALQR